MIFKNWIKLPETLINLMSKSHGIHKQSSKINAFLFNSIEQKKWTHQTMRRTMTKMTKTAKVNLKIWKYRPSNCLITRWKCVDNLPYIMHYILDDLEANNHYDCDCNSVDLLQFLNMFNSHVEYNMQVSLKRSDTKKEFFFLNEKDFCSSFSLLSVQSS